MDNKATYKVGYWAAVLVALEVAAFAAMLVAGLLGRDTGYFSFAVCFLLAASYVALATGIYQYSSNKRKIWANLGLDFGIMYAVLCSVSYYVQFAVVRNNSLQLPDSILKAFVYTPGSFVFALNMLGYAFLCLSTLMLVPVFYGRSQRERWLRRFMAFHGIFIIPTMIFPALKLGSGHALQSAGQFGNYALLFWCVIFIPIPLILAGIFKDMARPIKAN